MALPAGFLPASFRLEVGCLMCSTTAAIGNWSARQDLHLRLPSPRPGMLPLHHALFAPAIWKAPGAWFCWRRISPSLDGDPWRDLADPKGIAPSTFPQTTGRSAD